MATWAQGLQFIEFVTTLPHMFGAHKVLTAIALKLRWSTTDVAQLVAFPFQTTKLAG